jgi:hypothetical protein
MLSLNQCLNTYYDSILGLIKTMPSIFIWKSVSPNTSKKTIKLYNGINWYIEDNEHNANKSHSYKLTEQYNFSSNNETIVVNNCTLMPTNWIGGSELLQVLEVPYQFITVNEYGTCDQIGNWMRFTTKNDIDPSDLNTIYDTILSSINDTANYTKYDNQSSHIDYDNCLIHFDIENNNTEIISNSNMRNYISDKGYKSHKHGNSNGYTNKNNSHNNTNYNTNYTNKYNTKHNTYNKCNKNQHTNNLQSIPVSIQLTQ